VDLLQLVAELDELLEADGAADYCPNGLQVEGRPQIERIITAVSASRELFALAAERGADCHWTVTSSSGTPPNWLAASAS
jgi:putative NIF3 family GTP cyclohydrolase 1 type 2